MSPLVASQESSMRQQLLQLAPLMATSLEATAEQITQAMTDALTQMNENVGSSGVTLSITHTCRNIGCHDDNCELCHCNAYKQCQRHLDSRYMAFETLKSGCGADLYFELQNIHGTPDNALHILPITLEISAINARMHKAVIESGAGQDISEDDLLKCRLPFNKEGSAFLTTADNDHETTDTNSVRVVMTDAVVPLPKLTFTESSEALMPGQKPKVQLMVRAFREDGCRLPIIPLFVSEEFVVTTIRSTSRKPDICQEAQPVSKLQGVGKETVHKLKDIQAAAQASGRIADADILQDFTRHTKSITTVGDFQKLVRWCERDSQRAKTVQKVLKLMRGWDAAAAHALSAVPADVRPRAFYAGTGLALLYPCRDGKVDFEQTAGQARVTLSNTGQGYTLSPVATISGQQAAEQQQLKAHAKLEWAKPGHPGWSLVPAAGQQGQLTSQGFAKNTMPIAHSLCSAGSSNVDVDFQLQPDCLPNAPGLLLDNTPQANSVYSHSSASTDSPTMSGSERPASRKRSRQLQDLEVDLFFQTDLEAQQHSQAHPAKTSPRCWSPGMVGNIQAPFTLMGQANMLPDSSCHSTLSPFDLQLMDLQDLHPADCGPLHEIDMIGQLDAAVALPGHHAQSVSAPPPPVPASSPLPAHTNIAPPSPQGLLTHMSQAAFWQHGMGHHNLGFGEGTLVGSMRQTADPRLRLLPQKLSCASRSLPASIALDDFEMPSGHGLDWARSEHCRLKSFAGQQAQGNRVQSPFASSDELNAMLPAL